MLKIKKILNVISTIFTIFIVALAVLFVIFTITSRRDIDGTGEIFNKQIRLITTNSMKKCKATDVSSYKIKSLPANTLIFIDLVPTEKEEANKWYESLKEGDVLTFKYVYTEQIVITHRLIKKEYIKESDSYILYLSGDNKDENTNLLTQEIHTKDLDETTNITNCNYVIGKVVGKSYILGSIISAFKNPKTLIFIVLIIISIFILIEALKKILKVNKIEKNETALENQKIDEELNSLKKRIEDLSNK